MHGFHRLIVLSLRCDFQLFELIDRPFADFLAEISLHRSVTGEEDFSEQGLKLIVESLLPWTVADLIMLVLL